MTYRKERILAGYKSGSDDAGLAKQNDLLAVRGYNGW